jgi:hypothetical protein
VYTCVRAELWGVNTDSNASKFGEKVVLKGSAGAAVEEDPPPRSRQIKPILAGYLAMVMAAGSGTLELAARARPELWPARTGQN